MAKIIAFPGGQSAPPPAGAKHPKKTSPALPAWTALVDRSPWWRLADFLVREALEAPFKLGSAGELPPSIEEAALAVCPQRAANQPCDDLSEVRSILENLDYLRSNRKSLFPGDEAEGALEHPWRLWADLQSWMVKEHVWTSRRQAGCGPLFRDSVSSSLGFLQAACEQGPLSAARLLDLLDPCLRLGDEITALGRPLEAPKPRFGQPAAGRPVMPWEEDWYELVVEGFALPLGLVTSERRLEDGDGGAWNERRPYETLRVAATDLLASL
jgi:hypothetical protein